MINQLKHQISDLENNNTKLAREIIELNDIIQLKNSDIHELRKVI
jgi:predicted  nucleic acid-binding Zn-ribbon protein